MKAETFRLGQAPGCRNNLCLSSCVVGIMLALLASLLLIFGNSGARAQASGNVQAVGTMSDIMVSMVYPPANDLLLSIYRGGPQTDKDWMTAKRDAVLLAQSGTVLLARGPGGDGDWAQNARMLMEVGAAAYKAAGAKDTNAFIAIAQSLNASCTACHKQYRANLAGPDQRVGPSHQPGE